MAGPKEKKKINRKWLFYMVTIIVMIVFLHVVYISIDNGLAVEDNAYQQIEEEIIYFQTENLLLNQQILTSESLTSIYEKAIRLGFEPQGSNSIVYIIY